MTSGSPSVMQQEIAKIAVAAARLKGGAKLGLQP